MFARRVARRTARRTSRRLDRLDDGSKDQSYEAQLEELAKLRDEGLISDADYEAKKKLILGI
jgi:Short C-terminal domain